MLKIVTVFITLVFVALLWSDFAHADGASLYKTKCQMCHGASGQGNAALKTSPFDLAKLDVELIKVIKGGKGRMPAYGGKLTDVEVTEITKHLKTLK